MPLLELSSPHLVILCAVGAGVVFLTALRLRDGRLNCFEVGVVYFFVVALYAVYPLVGYLWNGQEYTLNNDLRMYCAAPSPDEMAEIGWFHLAHLGGFVAVYLLARGKGADLPVRLLDIDRRLLGPAATLYIGFTAFILALHLTYNLAAENYQETYLVTARLPLVLAQLYNHVQGARYTLELVMLAIMALDFRKYRLVLAGWLLAVVLMTFVQLGQRTQLMLVLAAAGMAYHVLVRPVAVWVAGLGAAGLLSLFILAGILRTGLTGGEELGLFGQASEFECMFANAYDVNRLKQEGEIGPQPLAFYATDVLAVIPQQVSPVTKINPGTWYVETFYPAFAEMGGAFAFGTISESIVGGGWPDLVVRGALLGLLLALAQRYWVANRHSFWCFVFYLWLTILCYNLYRSSTLYLIPVFCFRFLPVYGALRLITALGKDDRPLPVGLPPDLYPTRPPVRAGAASLSGGPAHS